MAIGTMFTLFVTPMVYTFLARDHAATIARERAAGHLSPDFDATEAP
jgi:multidrug efflux pump